MPTFLVHGFRWPRPLIRIHVILNNLDDAAAEWLMAPGTTRALKEDFETQSPAIMEYLPDLRFIEQYNPDDESADAKSQPYAYVCDTVQEIKLGIDIDEVRGKGVSNESWGAMIDLRDKLAPGEKVAWFVVVCGDTDRNFPTSAQTLETSEGTYPSSNRVGSVASVSDATITSRNDSGTSPTEEKKKSRLAKLFSSRTGGEFSLRRQKSSKSLSGKKASLTDIHIPPVPSHDYGSSNAVVSPPQTANTLGMILKAVNTNSSSHSQPNSIPPRAGILPSPPNSALPSPAYPHSTATAMPPLLPLISRDLPPSRHQSDTADVHAHHRDFVQPLVVRKHGREVSKDLSLKSTTNGDVTTPGYTAQASSMLI